MVADLFFLLKITFKVISDHDSGRQEWAVARSSRLNTLLHLSVLVIEHYVSIYSYPNGYPSLMNEIPGRSK